MTHRHLALELTRTIRHDGHSGAADDLDTVAGLNDWVHLRTGWSFTGDEEARRRVVELRAAVRALFARAVHPDAPSKADAGLLLDPRVALDRLNAAAAPAVPQLGWPEDGEPEIRHDIEADETTRLVATLAHAAMEFLASDDRAHLKACPAPRCVRYFVKEHPRQQWCKPSCGNRARVSRYYQRQTRD